MRPNEDFDLVMSQASVEIRYLMNQFNSGTIVHDSFLERFELFRKMSTVLLTIEI